MNTSAGFKLRLSEGDISKWAAKYSYSPADTDAPIVSEIRPAVLERGYLTRDEFRTICKWKTPRSQSKCARNDEHTIRTEREAREWRV